MRLLQLTAISVGVLLAFDARAAVIAYESLFNLRAFPDTAPGGFDNFGGFYLGGYDFQDTTVRSSAPSTVVGVSRFDSALGDLQSVQLQLFSTISPARDYDYDASSGGQLVTGYFPGYTHDGADQFEFPFLVNDVGLSYRINATLALDPLTPDLLPAAMGLTSFASCFDSDTHILIPEISCSTNDPNGFGVFVFDYGFTIADPTAFVGIGSSLLRASIDAQFIGFCDYDDDNDFAGQDFCRVDPSFTWSGGVRVSYTYTERTPGGGGGEGGGNGGEGGGEGGGGTPTPVPEPASVALLGIGLLALVAVRRRRFPAI